MRSWPISTRLVAAFALLTGLLAVTAFVAYGVAGQFHTAALRSTVSERQARQAGDAAFAAASVALDENSVAYDFSSRSDPSGDLQSLAADETTARAAIQGLAGAAQSTAQRDAVGTAQTALEAYVAQSAAINKDFHLGTPAALARASTGVAALHYGKIADPLAAFATDQQKRSAVRSAAAGRTATRDRSVVVGTAALAVLAALGLGFLISRSILRPLRDVVNVLEAVGGGDLTRCSSDTSSDEIGRMARALNAALSRMRATITAVSGHAGALAGAAHQLAEVSGHMSRQASETAVQVDVIAGARRRSNACSIVPSIGTGSSG